MLSDEETGNLIQKAVESFSKFYTHSANGLKQIADYGWYLDGGITMGHGNNLMEEALKNNQAFIDNYLMDYYGNNIDDLASSLSKNDDQKIIILEAIDCHKKSKFFASTILFLSLADGICNGLLFKTRNEKDALRKYLEEFGAGNFATVLFGQIVKESAIDEYFPKRGKYNSLLNRHGIMHGLDSSYGTKINSLKAFSLLSFVSDFVDRYREKNEL